MTMDFFSKEEWQNIVLLAPVLGAASVLLTLRKPPPLETHHQILQHSTQAYSLQWMVAHGKVFPVQVLLPLSAKPQNETTGYISCQSPSSVGIHQLLLHFSEAVTDLSLMGLPNSCLLKIIFADNLSYPANSGWAKCDRKKVLLQACNCSGVYWPACLSSGQTQQQVGSLAEIWE